MTAPFMMGLCFPTLLLKQPTGKPVMWSFKRANCLSHKTRFLLPIEQFTYTTTLKPAKK